MLTEEGTAILKFFLYISRRSRSSGEDRLEDASKNWKFNIGDLAERKHWESIKPRTKTRSTPLLRRTPLVHRASGSQMGAGCMYPPVLVRAGTASDALPGSAGGAGQGGGEVGVALHRTIP